MSARPGDAPRVYRDLDARERGGWVLGLSPPQALACLALVVPVLLALTSGSWGHVVGLVAVDGLLVALVVVPVRGRPPLRWLADLVSFRTGVLMRWSLWQSKAAAGLAGPPGEPDLPGVLTRVEFPDGPPFRDQGRLCLIHDTGDGRWGATARLAHSGVGMLSDTECERLAGRLGHLLVAMGRRDVVDRLSLLVRTVPDDGTEYGVWRSLHEVPDAPLLARRAADELDRTVGAASVRSELFVTVSGPETALRRPAAAAGGGVEGRASVLYRVLDGLDDALTTLGVQSVTWLSGSGMAAAIRTGFNPAAAAGLTRDRLTGRSGLPLSAAGPALAPAPAARAYHHDGFSTVSYAAMMPPTGTVFGSLGPLLAVRSEGERRTVAIHYEALSARAAARAVRSGRFRSTAMRDWRAARGVGDTATDRRRSDGARDQESAVAAGQSMVRFTVAASVTVPADRDVEDHAARLENDASGRFRLLRLELAQDSAFVAAVLPVGIGLPRLRGGLDG
ncbi:SCO6880 family protein [Pseudonocardia sp. N23]|uniref:SCO6880 family protein n=1 Tax=Pseudonocardia sp. N23 TaxID=1987376 RepID=UPI000BFE13C4|nr:SCO6880 family protein [Pseudonocardia sp. N23]GAY13162.1 putative integral membrane protein [Pseudonocardia sp. N23]